MSKNTFDKDVFSGCDEIKLDSIGLVKLVVLIEEEFGITFPDEKLLLSEVNTMEKLVSIVESEIKHVK